MPINVTGLGTTSVNNYHYFRKTNVNTVDDFIYFTDDPGNKIPTALTEGTGFIYRNGVGSVAGLTNEGLVFVKKDENSWANVIKHFTAVSYKFCNKLERSLASLSSLVCG